MARSRGRSVRLFGWAFVAAVACLAFLQNAATVGRPRSVVAGQRALLQGSGGPRFFKFSKVPPLPSFQTGEARDEPDAAGGSGAGQGDDVEAVPTEVPTAAPTDEEEEEEAVARTSPPTAPPTAAPVAEQEAVQTDVHDDVSDDVDFRRYVDFGETEREWEIREHEPEDLIWDRPPDKLSHLKDAAVVVIAYNRPDLLRESLEALNKAALSKHAKVYVSQDGMEPAVMDVANNFEAMGRVTHIVHPRKILNNTVRFVLGQATPARAPGTMYLAAHYKWALDQMFVERDHTHAIILEDDMLVSKDFLAFFEMAAPLLDIDPSLWCVSSWNDNGYRHLDLNKKQLFRTQFFPGLGWMLKRETWMELRKSWPIDQWDHWMRVWSTSSGRECVCPFLPRNRNVGAGGANSNGAFFRRHLQSIAHYDKQPIGLGDLSYLLRPAYTKRLREKLAGEDVVYLSESAVRFGDDDGSDQWWGGKSTESVYVVLFAREKFERLSKQLMIYPTPRAFHHYVHELHYQGHEVYLADRRLSPLLPERRRVRPEKRLRAVVARRTQMSCNDVCEALDGGWECARGEFDWVNQCKLLQRVFDGCPNGCRKEWGMDIPNLQQFRKGENPFGKNQCLITEDVPTCEARHAKTKRLCPCVLRGHSVDRDNRMKPVAAPRLGQSCHEVCEAHAGGYSCDESQFRYVNKCDVLRRTFKCASCDQNHGKDIPNFVDDPSDPNYRKCLIQREPPSCDGKHPHTRRLCPCVPER
eukprot:TRINITY_DN8930_c0_g1_i1.p1 TRINITY_DN8930_c0_g1~~TRINITY_DN8930_c0_g1_i1.p1  ORF type:complete len:751 (+),score=190.91 TRINITY_DN8930_c0_g1_i1:203-2455(+)